MVLTLVIKMSENMVNDKISYVSVGDSSYVNRSFNSCENGNEIKDSSAPVYQSRRDSLLLDIFEHRKSWTQADIENAGIYSKNADVPTAIGIKR